MNTRVKKLETLAYMPSFFQSPEQVALHCLMLAVYLDNPRNHKAMATALQDDDMLMAVGDACMSLDAIWTSVMPRYRKLVQSKRHKA